ncbi:hypothetical protein ONZ45_g16669 [Pleurotus djamor]|nr:hypothetical protein ONZ45_g16669 [Pleurotus djamor]
MPPKRKASQASVETPTKRRTRPRTVVPEEPQVRVLRSTSISSLATEPRTPTTRRVTTTYGSTRKREVLAHSRKENEKDDEAADAENSDDPLAYHPAENVETPRRARVPVARETKPHPAPSASKGKYTDYTININDDSDEDANSDDELMLSAATAPNTPSKRSSRKQPEVLTPSPRKPQAPAVEIEVPLTSRRKARGAASPTKSSRSHPISGALPAHLTPCFHLQKRAMLRFLRSPMDLSMDEEEPSPNDIAAEQLNTLLRATVERGEGNSCLVIGPRGSGKSHVVRSCLASLPQQPIVIHLSGLTEHNDRLAMREIARQLSEQTGQTYAVDDDADDANAADQEENPFLDTGTTAQDSIFLPPPSHLPALISSLPTLSRPTVTQYKAVELEPIEVPWPLLE